jgi:hypothetical protein
VRTDAWLDRVLAAPIVAVLAFGLTLSPAAAVDAPQPGMAATAPLLPIGLPMTISTCDADASGWTTGEPWALDMRYVIPLCTGGFPGGGRWLDWEPTSGTTADLIQSVLSPPDGILVPSWQGIALGNTNSSALQDALNSRSESVITIPLLDAVSGSGSNQEAHVGRTAEFVIDQAYVAGDNRAACGATIRCIVGTFVDRSIQIVSLTPLDDVTYGASPLALEASASSGLSVTLSASGPCAITGATVTIDGAGACQVTASQAGSVDYLPASTTDTFTIARPTLTVTAADTTRTLGATGPAFTVRYIGFVNDETPSVLGGTLLVAPTTSVSTTSPGVFVLRASGLTASNYTISYVDGALTSVYRICLLYDPAKPASGGTVPLKLYLCNNAGTDLSTSGVTVTALAVEHAGVQVKSLTGTFKFDRKLGPSGGHQFDLPTSGLAGGTSYALKFRVASDPSGVSQYAPFVLKAGKQ